MPMKKTVTPWINEKEWIKVSRYLYSSRLEQQHWAVNRIAVWKVRCHPKILTEIDATEALVRAKIHAQLALQNKTFYDTSDIIRLYSMGLIRFMKLVHELGVKRGISSVNRAAKLLDIPRWVADLRHDVTHANIPPIVMLNEGTDFALNWLKNYYWEPESNDSSDYTEISDDDSYDTEELSIKKLINCFYQQQYKQLSQGSTRIRIDNILKKVQIAMKNNIYEFSRILTEAGYLLPDHHKLLYILKEKEMEFLMDESLKLPRSVLYFWMPVLKLYNTKQKISCLIDSLLLSSKPTSTHLHRRLVAAWVIKLIKNEKTKSINWNVPQLDWSKVLKNALLCHNEYSPAFLPQMLSNMDIVIPEDKKQDLMALVAIKLGKTVQKVPKYSEKQMPKIYTVVDIQEAKLQKAKMDNDIEEENQTSWQICMDNASWEKWPIGSLPEGDFESICIDSQVEDDNPDECNDGTSKCNEEVVESM